MKQIVLAITGASGAVYAQRLAEGVLAAGAQLHLVASPHGRRVLADELDLRHFDAESFLPGAAGHTTVYSYHDIGARIASGSFRTDGMVLCPCSSNTLAAVAGGLADNLITRAALVTLKEARRLILVPRETPLSQIEIANLLRVSQAGGVVCPACPGFYMRPASIADLVDFVVGRVLDLLDLRHELPVRWNPHPQRTDDTAP
jgi:4-hydroxy-3-polyprenylbenzoate decarboxylase